MALSPATPRDEERLLAGLDHAGLDHADRFLAATSRRPGCRRRSSDSR